MSPHFPTLPFTVSKGRAHTPGVSRPAASAPKSVERTIEGAPPRAKTERSARGQGKHLALVSCWAAHRSFVPFSSTARVHLPPFPQTLALWTGMQFATTFLRSPMLASSGDLRRTTLSPCLPRDRNSTLGSNVCLT